MQSRTFLRIEGDLVSLITEVIDREVTLPDLLAELTTVQVAMTPRLPTGCRFWIRSGTTDRSVFVVEQPPSRRMIEYHASRRPVLPGLASGDCARLTVGRQRVPVERPLLLEHGQAEQPVAVEQLHGATREAVATDQLVAVAGLLRCLER